MSLFGALFCHFDNCCCCFPLRIGAVLTGLGATIFYGFALIGVVFIEQWTEKEVERHLFPVLYMSICTVLGIWLLMSAITESTRAIGIWIWLKLFTYLYLTVMVIMQFITNTQAAFKIMSLLSVELLLWLMIVSYHHHLEYPSENYFNEISLE